MSPIQIHRAVSIIHQDASALEENESIIFQQIFKVANQQKKKSLSPQISG